MKNSRPMSIIKLKRRFLKALYITRVKNKVSYPYQVILRSAIPRIFNIAPPLNIEYENGKAAIKELSKDGYIELVAGKKYIYFLTKKGFDVAIKNIEDMKIQNVDFFSLLVPRFDLLRKVQHNYYVGDFEDAVFKAYKFLEERVRLKAQQPSSVYGVPLMDKAFKPVGGLLKHPRTEIKAEQEGVHFLMRGAISFFKNPSSHRSIDWDDPNKTAHVIAFAKELLDLVDECELVKNK